MKLGIFHRELTRMNANKNLNEIPNFEILVLKISVNSCSLMVQLTSN